MSKLRQMFQKDKIKEYFQNKFGDVEEELTPEQKEEQRQMIYELIDKEFENYAAEYHFAKENNFSNDERKREVEDKILKLIEEDESVLTIQDIDGCNIGMRACDYELERIAFRALENKEAALQQPYLKEIGFMSIQALVLGCQAHQFFISIEIRIHI